LGGYGKVVQLWLDKGANINVQGARYGNALQAASIEGHEKVAQLLLDRGTVANAQRWGVRQRAAGSNGWRPRWVVELRKVFVLFVGPE
jgi:ankyrin repeat protein